jgi:hypothetical protein
LSLRSVVPEYLAELVVFDEVIVRMKLAALVQNRSHSALIFGEQGWPRGIGGAGEQQVACMKREGFGSNLRGSRFIAQRSAKAD